MNNKRKTFSKLFVVAVFSTAISLHGCKKDSKKDQVPVIPNEEEIITTLVFTLTPADSGEKVVFQFQDIDGDGGNAPVTISDTLLPNTTYNSVLQLFNETLNPVDDITEEVKEEGTEHQLFYKASQGKNVVISYADTDANGHPIGLSTTVTTTNPSAGTLKITLRHEPDKNAAGVMNGDITNAGGETDIEVIFDLIVK